LGWVLIFVIHTSLRMAPSLFVLRAGERLVPSLDAQVTGIADNLRFHHAKSSRTKLRTFTYQAGSRTRPRKVVARLECSLQPDVGEAGQPACARGSTSARSSLRSLADRSSLWLSVFPAR
jgi:hypothetical protein